MDSLIVTAYAQLLAADFYVVGENIGTDSPIWKGVSVVHEDCLNGDEHLMMLGEVLDDQDACILIFNHITRVYFEM